jgi:hypothetical protein
MLVAFVPLLMPPLLMLVHLLDLVLQYLLVGLLDLFLTFSFSYILKID